MRRLSSTLGQKLALQGLQDCWHGRTRSRKCGALPQKNRFHIPRIISRIAPRPPFVGQEIKRRHKKREKKIALSTPCHKHYFLRCRASQCTSCARLRRDFLSCNPRLYTPPPSIFLRLFFFFFFLFVFYFVHSRALFFSGFLCGVLVLGLAS